MKDEVVVFMLVRYFAPSIFFRHLQALLPTKYATWLFNRYLLQFLLHLLSKVKVLQEGQTPENKCPCFLSPYWCWLYFNRRQRHPGCICFCWLVEDTRAALFTVTELPLLCDIMTANSRAILKCVNSYVYACRLT